MTDYRITAYVNVGEGNFFGYHPRHEIAEVHTFVLARRNVTLHDVAENMWAIGNRIGCDSTGATWPSDVRSMSVGDVLAIRDPETTRTSVEIGEDYAHWFVCESAGWKKIAFRPGNVVPIEGTKATSRGAA